MSVSKQTRKESFEDIQAKKHIRYAQILGILHAETEGLTAKEIAVEMHKMKLVNSSERNWCAPRLTELIKKGLVVVEDKKQCKWSGKTVSVYKLKKIEYGV